jgi:vitamin B12 transporter
MKKTIQISLLTTALISSLYGENQYTLESIEVTGTQATSLNKKDVTDSVIVINKEAIEESHAKTLDEALYKLGGISIANNGGLGKSTSMFVRGMTSKRILVLIDGVRYNDPSSVGASADIAQLMLNNIEQIEIIKGAQSGVWGADASGGVINIITSGAQKGFHSSVNLEYGSFSTLKTALNLSYGDEDFDVLLNGSFLNTDGFSAVEPKKEESAYGKRYDELNLEEDSYKNTSLNLKLGLNFSKDDRLEFGIKSINSAIEFDSSAGVLGDSIVPNSDIKSKFYNIVFSHKDALNNIKASYNFSNFDREMELESWGGSGVDIYKYKGSVNEFKIDDKISYMQDSFLRVGASHQKFEQEDVTPNINKSYTAISTFMSNYNKFSLIQNLNTIITESLRYDKYDAFDNAITGKLGIKQFLYSDIYLSSNFGTGFNAPTLGQLYGAFGANPDLKPEKTQTFDITLGNDTLWLTGFYNEIEDLIDYVITDYTTYAGGYAQIDGKSTFKGVEFGYEDIYFNTLGINAMYTYVISEDADGLSLQRRPKTQLNLGTTYYVLDNFDIGFDAQYIGERYDQKDDQGAQTGKYTLVNFTTNYALNKFFSFYGKIDNISDKYYQSADGYASAGRSYYIGLNATY